ncbi:IS21 family transposase [Rhodoglobus vestalii]|uniref:IS21 family transposase n=1 Tax=Rhodoglobus vestalii TaxID=193384 RepID=UPI00114D9982|nr:IS21 family transposase [Rhodoglobus vestalii]
MEQFERIRRDARDKEMSVRELARVYGVHRRTVRAALTDSTPPPRKVPERIAPAMGPWLEIVRAWLVADLEAPRKQRHTARRVWQRLVDEYGATVAESTVTHAVARIRRELIGTPVNVAVPQTHAPGAEAEVDFGEFQAVIGGSMVKLFMFVLRLSYSGRAVHVAYANQAQESFLDGHNVAFERLGGIPSKMIRYDNLTPAVIRVALGRERLENPRFIAMRSHYGFDSFFCIPGIEGAHEKGGVEGEVGRFRRRWLTPVPEFQTLAALNEFMAVCDEKDQHRVISARPVTVGTAATAEAPELLTLPSSIFEAGPTSSVKVNHKAEVCVRQCYYSVPVSYAGRRVSVRIGAALVEVFADGKRIAVHVRAVHKYAHVLDLDHYLEVLTRKPGAMAGATALVTARASGAFTPIHQKFWDKARHQLGDGAGTRALIGVLLLARTLPATAVIEAMETAIAAADYDPDRLAVAARANAAFAPIVTQLPEELTDRVVHLPERGAPSLAGYDQLLVGAR